MTADQEKNATAGLTPSPGSPATPDPLVQAGGDSLDQGRSCGHDHEGVRDPSLWRTALWHELSDHIPFSAMAVAIGLVFAGTICILGYGGQNVAKTVAGSVHSGEHAPDDATAPDGGADSEPDEHAGHGHAAHSDPAILFFHLFHPAHMLFSAAATTAMFRRYEKKTGKAIAVGLAGAIGVCGFSDILMPHASLWILGADIPLHLCVVRHPMLVLPFALVGVLIGLGAARGVVRSTIFSHSMHVLASTMASIFYMVGPLGMVAWIDNIGMVFFFVVVAVLVPCCLSDVVFPMAMTAPARAQYLQEPHGH